MNINRFNYEEYFLLYVDNELSSDDRAAVEVFVQENPDLREELNMLLQSVVKADKKITFADKASLMRNSAASNPVNETNYEEYFLLYGDDELNNEEKDWVEQFVYKHPQYQSEFELLQSIRFTPNNSIVFPDKQSLYRHEKDERVIVMRWWRIAAAAVVVLMIGGAALYFSSDKVNNNNTGNQGALAGKTKGNAAKSDPSTDNSPKKTVDPLVSEEQENIADVNNADNYKKNNEQKSIEGKKENTPFIDRQPQQSLAQVEKKSDEKSNPERNSNVIQSDAGDLIADAGVPASKRNTEQTESTGVNAASLTHDDLAANDIVQVPAEFASNTDDSQIEVLNTTVSNKSKMRGFFRKVGRVVGKATNIESSEEREDKKGVRIASFQIALK